MRMQKLCIECGIVDEVLTVQFHHPFIWLFIWSLGMLMGSIFFEVLHLFWQWGLCYCVFHCIVL